MNLNIEQQVYKVTRSYQQLRRYDINLPFKAVKYFDDPKVHFDGKSLHFRPPRFIRFITCTVNDRLRISSTCCFGSRAPTCTNDSFCRLNNKGMQVTIPTTGTQIILLYIKQTTTLILRASRLFRQTIVPNRNVMRVLANFA